MAAAVPLNRIIPKAVSMLSKLFLRQSRHFYEGKGRGMTLSEIGHLENTINHYFYNLGRLDRVNAQIIDEARNHPTGNFGYYFDGSYSFHGIAF